MFVVFVEELPTLFLIERSVENGASLDSFAQVLHDRMLLIIWHKEGTGTTSILLDKTQYDMLLIPLPLLTYSKLLEVNHHGLVWSAELTCLDCVKLVPRYALTCQSIKCFNHSFGNSTTLAIYHVLCHFSEGKFRLKAFQEVIENAACEHLQ